MCKMKENKGHFKKGNSLRYIPSGNEPLTAHIGLKLTEKDKIALKQIPDWSAKLRGMVKQLIEEHSD